MINQKKECEYFMAIFDHERKNGIQLGTVRDECIECRKKHRGDELYEPEKLDYKPVYKIWINNLPHCMCLDCFQESLGDYMLVAPGLLEENLSEPEKEEKPKANNRKSKKKEDDKDGGETA